MRTHQFLLYTAICAVGLVASISTAASGDRPALAAVFPPWWSASRAFAAAGEAGDIINTGMLPFVVVVRSQRPGLDVRLRAAGAFLVFNPLGAAGCAQPSIGGENV